MMKALILAILLAVASATTLQQDMKSFVLFLTKYGKSYSDVEFGRRFQVFRDNIQIANGLQSRETGSARYGITKFMDLTSDEFRANYLMPKEIYANFEIDAAKVMKPLKPVPLPVSFDWSQKGALTPVYDQGQCGSCWAFSATETIESFHFLSGRALLGLSQQQIVDCDTTSYGCNGGWTQNAFNYVAGAGGQDTLASYPYTAQDGSCQYNPSNVGAKISGYTYVTQSDDENAMIQALYQTGPLSICVDASSWQFYNGGVITAANCGTQVDHCVQLTGFSNQGGTDAWNVRNSWGTSWGVGGHLYLARGGNTCAIGSCVTYVTATGF